MQNAGMNFLGAFDPQGNFGARARQDGTNKALAPLLAQGTQESLSQAQTIAADRGDMGALEGIKKQMAALGSDEKVRATTAMKAAGQIAGAGLQKFGNDPDRAAGYIRYWGPQFGLNPEQIERAAANPIVSLQGMAAQADDFSKAFAENSKNVTLSQGQTRFDAIGGEIASVAAKPTSLAEGAQLIGPNGEVIANNEKAAPQAAPMTEYQRGMLAIKEKEAENKGSSLAGEFGLSPVYGRDKDGNRILIQTNKGGGVRAAELPDGVTLEDDYYKTKAKATAKADVKKMLSKNKAGLSLQMYKTKVDNIKNKAALAITQSTSGNTGPLQGRVSISQKSADLDSSLDTIKAVIGFKELQDMRDSSPTGGALGQVTEKEIRFLQSMIASLERTQSEGQLDQNLEQVIKAIEESYARMEGAYIQDYENGLFGGGGDAPDEWATTSSGVRYRVKAD